jgi:ankyrin repeat protein
VVPLLDLDGVTLDSEEDSALHIVAASGDSDQYLNCAELIYGKAGYLLDAANKSGDTPLHCAATAGNLDMVSRLIELATRENNGGKKQRALELLRKKSKTGETALHMAIRSANRKKVIEKLMSEDMELVRAPGGGILPLYLAVSLGHLDIMLELMQRSCKRLSYSWPEGQNVLHAAVFQGEGTFA